MKTTKEKIAIMQAYEDGKVVEFKNKQSIRNWYKLPVGVRPIWDWAGQDYQIKSQPKDIWVNEYADKTYDSYLRKEHALLGGANASCVRSAVHYREVMEDK